MDLTLAAIPGYFGSMAAEHAWLVRHRAERGPTAGDYERRDTITSLTIGVGSLVVPRVPERVLRPALTDDHRLEWMQMWQPVPKPVPRKGVDPIDMPQPTWVLPEPLKLATRGHRPLYQGILHLLTGPHRVEGGWWHRLGEGEQAKTGHVQRDYWVALSEHAGVLWVFQERLASDETAWYLHGVFA